MSHSVVANLSAIEYLAVSSLASEWKYLNILVRWPDPETVFPKDLARH